MSSPPSDTLPVSVVGSAGAARVRRVGPGLGRWERLGSTAADSASGRTRRQWCAPRDATQGLFVEIQTLLDEVGVLADDSWMEASAPEQARAARRANLKLREYDRDTE